MKTVSLALAFSILAAAGDRAAAAEPTSLVPAPVPGGLTAEEAARRAAATSREFGTRAEAAAGAAAALAQVRAGYWPRLSGTARYTRLSETESPALGTLVAAPGAPAGPLAPGTSLVAVPLSFPVLTDQYAATATLQVPVSDYLLRLPALTEAARASAEAAALLASATRLKVATEARVLYYGWARRRLEAVIAERSLAQAREHLDDARLAAEAGRASKADVLRVESQVAATELLVTRARAAAAIAEHRLRTMMHDDSGRPYQIGEDLTAMPDPDPSPLAATAEALVGQALDHRLEPKALAAGAGAARAQARATLAAALPRLDAVANATHARPNARIFPQRDEFRGSWDASVQLSWSPTDLVAARAGQRVALARARQQESEREAVRDGIRMEVTEAAEAVRQAEAAHRTAARGLAAAEESYRVRRSLFKNGRATSVELTDAETELMRAQLDAVAARLDHRIARAGLEHALGRDATERRAVP